MKPCVALILIYALVTGAAAQHAIAPVPDVTHVATAVNHLTVLEFHEPVTMAAAGSPDFQIERQENKVFVKPLKSGAATDLFVWTSSRRFAYELETTEEVKNMNFAIDSPAPAPPQQPVASASDEVADLMLTQVFLETEAIEVSRTLTAKNKVHVLIEQVFRTKSSVYIHYFVENNSKLPWHLAVPTAICLESHDANPVLPTLVRRQLDQRSVEQLGSMQEFPLPVVRAESRTQDVQPGETAHGIVVIRKGLDSPVIVQLVFDSQVKAVVVL
jgi:hypothetical protein